MRISVKTIGIYCASLAGMQEAFLHHLWRTKKVGPQFTSTAGHNIHVQKYGTLNLIGGPDFNDGLVSIDGQSWAGRIEMHLRSSDWDRHGHTGDPEYDNVILHVVWEHDKEITLPTGQVLPVIALKGTIDPIVLERYLELYSAQQGKFIPCEQHIAGVDDFVVDNWMERMLLERLESRQDRINRYLQHFKGDWEAVLFTLLLRSMGTKVNAESFELLAMSTPIKVIRKLRNNLMDLEALLLGQAGLLEAERSDATYTLWRDNYKRLAHMHDLRPVLVAPRFSGLRPPNFPTIRLSQLAAVYHGNETLFSSLMLSRKLKHMRAFFAHQASSTWDSRFNFPKNAATHTPDAITSSTPKNVVDEQHASIQGAGAPVAVNPKKLTTAFIDLLIINTIVPLQFAYARSQGRDDLERAIEILSEMKAESNTIIKKFNSCRPGMVDNAFKSQAALQLKKEYCSELRCLDCAIGNSILRAGQ